MNYYDIIESWVREFILTMDHIDDLEVGNDSGDTPGGIKIIFDGFGYDEKTDQENADKNTMSFAVFVHKNSLTEEFPPHDLTPWALIHRPSEEVCFYVWYDVEGARIDVSDLYDSDTELDYKFVEDLIVQIYKRDNLDEE